jgi:dTDP-4-amino-4,6-dideoxy-D-glucose transaminase
MKLTEKIPAILGGNPVSEKVLGIVRPVFPPLEDFYDSFSNSLKSGQVTNQSYHVRAFEKELTKKIGVPAIVTSSGQTALMLMLRATGIDSGEVICPSYTFCATPHAIRWCGAEPVFIDVSPKSFCITPKEAEKEINEKTKAILGVDVYGITCDYKGFETLGEKYGIKILFDSAPAFGSKVDGRYVGGYGDAQSFSFHATKGFSTMEGGALFSKSPELLKRAKALRNFGQGDNGDCVEAGFNAKMLEICAIIGRKQLKTLDQILSTREKIAKIYQKGFGKMEGLYFAEPSLNQNPVWLYFPIIIDSQKVGLSRDKLVDSLHAENLKVRKYFDPPCHLMTGYLSKKKLPVTEQLSNNVIALPIYNDMIEEEAEFFVQGIEKIISHAKTIILR